MTSEIFNRSLSDKQQTAVISTLTMYTVRLLSLTKKCGTVYSVVLMRHLWWNNMPNHISVFFVYTRMEMFLTNCISTEFFRTPYIQMWNQCWGFYLMIQDTIGMVVFLFFFFDFSFFPLWNFVKRKPDIVSWLGSYLFLRRYWDQFVKNTSFGDI